MYSEGYSLLMRVNTIIPVIYNLHSFLAFSSKLSKSQSFILVGIRRSNNPGFANSWLNYLIFKIHAAYKPGKS